MWKFHDFSMTQILREIILTVHSVEKREILSQQLALTKIFFRQINSLVTYLVKSLFSRNFCQTCVKENSRNFHSTLCAMCGKVR